ncbi:recombinase family protein [Nocardia thraciensis]
MAGQRVLGRIRLSRFTDESTSPERQQDIIKAYAKANDDQVIGWAVDIDVSRTVDPFNTPELGKWLKEDRAAEWDKIAGWKLDRIATGSIYLNKMIGWCQENNKTLVSVTENFDLSHWVGRMIANVIAGMAEGELEAITERIQFSRKKLLEVGRWPGGRPPFGRIPEKSGVGWTLAIDPEAKKTIDWIGDLLIQGNAVDWIRDQLNDDDVLPPSEHFRKMKRDALRGSKWSSKAIWDTMQNKTALLGYATRDKETVRDMEGMPIQYGEPLMTKERFDDIQEALEKRRTGPVRTRNTQPLLGVAYCYDCRKQHAHRVMPRDYGKQEYRYYHCITKGCSSKTMMDAGSVEKLLEESFLADVGDKPERKRIYVPPSNSAAELAEAQEAVGEIAAMLATAKSQSVKDRLKEQMSALDTRIEALEQTPVEEGGYKYEDTGRTYREAWEACETPEERRQLLLKYGVTLRIKQTDRTRTGPGVLHYELTVPEDLVARMAS